MSGHTSATSISPLFVSIHRLQLLVKSFQKKNRSETPMTSARFDVFNIDLAHFRGKKKSLLSLKDSRDEPGFLEE